MSLRATWPHDLAAGATVAAMLVPQSMGYAMLAGLPPSVGLYASTFPLLAYALLGSSRHLAVGPVAIISLFVLSGLSPLATPGSPEYLVLALTLSLMVGAILLLLGLFRLGFVVNFMSHAVISGLVSAAALVITASQLGPLLGLRLSTSGQSIFPTLVEAAGQLHQVNSTTLAVGASALILLLLCKRFVPRFPAPLLAVFAGTLVSYLADFDRTGVALVGEVPQGLAPFSTAGLDPALAPRLVPTALTIVLLGYVEAIAIAKVFAARGGYRLDPNRELLALGAANLCAGFFSAYPVTGSFSRTAVNYEAGARTRLSSLVTVALLLLTLTLFTPFFDYLPKTVLAAIVIVAVTGLLDFREARHLFRVRPRDGLALVVTFLTTLVAGLDVAILVGVAFSLAVLLWDACRPHTAQLGYVAEENSFRDLTRFPEARVFPGVLIFRIDASLYFLNMGFVEDRLRELVAARDDLEWVVLDFSGVNDLDAVSLGMLDQFMTSHSTRGVRFALCGLKGPIRDLTTRYGWTEDTPFRRQYRSVHQALRELGFLDSRR